jgi:NNP family nitrate/nitrite transporter-like MFS transporter
MTSPPSTAKRTAVLTWSTIAFTLLFAVWLMFGVLALPIRSELKLSETQFAWLTAIAVLNGSFWRLAFGLLADRFGGRRMMTLLLLVTAIPTFLVAFAHSFGPLLLLAFLIGMAGNGFTIGITWNARWFPREVQGTALGVFGAGNVGASLTKIIGPAMIAMVPAAGLAGGTIPGGWRFIPLLYTLLLLITAVLTWFLTPADLPTTTTRTLSGQLKPLANLRVWRFSLYYVALSVWLPRYYKDVYHLTLGQAAGLTALFIFPASLLRPVGGWLSDRYGPRTIMYAVFTLLCIASFFLMLPNGTLTLTNGHTLTVGSGPAVFTVLMFLVGIGMGIGKAAVYKYVPEYFPNDIAAVGGLVGALGGLGGFFLPPLFAGCEALAGFPQATFIAFFALAASFLWLHLTVLKMTRKPSSLPTAQPALTP